MKPKNITTRRKWTSLSCLMEIKVILLLTAATEASNTATTGSDSLAWPKINEGRDTITTPTMEKEPAKTSRTRSFSPRKNASSSMVENGEEKKIADASARGNERIDRKKKL
jgi:hypothetical protein